MAFHPALSDNEEVQLLGVFPWMHSRNSDFPVRPTILKPFCRSTSTGSVLKFLDRFDNQQGWDGVILGHRDWPYQFEFTARRDESVVPPAPTPEHFLVFCIPEGEYWQKRLKALFEAGFQQVTPPQLYADEGTATYEDPDGYRVVLRCGRWKK